MRILVWLIMPFNPFTLRRWVDMLVLGLAGLAICLLLSPILGWLAAGTEWMFTQVHGQILLHLDVYEFKFEAWPPSLVTWLGVIFCALTLLVIPTIHVGAVHFGQMKSFLLYPPAWVAAVMTLPLIVWYYTIEGTASPREVLGAVAFLIAAVTLALLVMTVHTSPQGFFRKFRSEEDRTPPTAAETLKAFTDDPMGLLIPWLMKEEAVEDLSQDLFESHRFARHIVNLLTLPDLGGVGLIGPWGSGKTTVLNLADYILHKSSSFDDDYRTRWQDASGLTWRVRHSPPKVLTCRVRAWGFVKEPVVSVVLREAISELSRRVDCLAMRSMPEKYVLAMKGMAPAWIHGPLSVATAESPSDQLRRLDPILSAINARLVIYIEDLDRNVELPDVSVIQNVRTEGRNIVTDFRNDVSARPNGRIFVEIESLLDRMADVPRVSFVLALSGVRR